MIMCKIMVKPISCKPFERLSYDKYDVWNVWNAFARRVLDSERENESERGKKVRKRGWESTRKARARSIKKKRNQRAFCCAICEWMREWRNDRDAYVVRSFRTCDTSAGKLDFRPSMKGRIRHLPVANQKEDVKSEVSPEVDAGWVAHLLKVLWGRNALLLTVDCCQNGCEVYYYLKYVNDTKRRAKRETRRDLLTNLKGGGGGRF